MNALRAIALFGLAVLGVWFVACMAWGQDAPTRADIYYGSRKVDGPEFTKREAESELTHAGSKTNVEPHDESLILRLSPPKPLAFPNEAGPMPGEGTSIVARSAAANAPSARKPDLANRSSRLGNPLRVVQEPISDFLTLPPSNDALESIQIDSLTNELGQFELSESIAASDAATEAPKQASFDAASVAAELPTPNSVHRAVRLAPTPMAPLPIASASQRPSMEATSSTGQLFVFFGLGVAVSFVSFYVAVMLFLRQLAAAKNAVFRVEMHNAAGGSLAVVPSQQAEAGEELAKPRRSAEITDFSGLDMGAVSTGETYAEKQLKKQAEQSKRESAILETLFDQNQQLRQSGESARLTQPRPRKPAT